MTAPSPEFDPTAGLFLPAPRGPAVPLRYRSGRLTSWDPTDGSNAVVIDGETFSNLPILPGAWLSVLTVGATLTLLSTTDEAGISTYAIVGAPITPPDVRIATASRAAGFAKYTAPPGTINTTVTSTSYVVLGSSPQTKMFKVSAVSRVEIEMTGSCYTDDANAGVVYGVQVDGVSNVNILRNNAANSMLFSHTPWAGGELIDLPGDGEHTFQPIWARSGVSGTVLMDLSDQLTMTIREIL